MLETKKYWSVVHCNPFSIGVLCTATPSIASLMLTGTPKHFFEDCTNKGQLGQLIYPSKKL